MRAGPLPAPSTTSGLGKLYAPEDIKAFRSTAALEFRRIPGSEYRQISSYPRKKIEGITLAVQEQPTSMGNNYIAQNSTLKLGK